MLKGARMFRQVALGGTFDGIHSGHKRLFEEALGICSERLVVGVTDTSMIRNKTLWELILPLEERIKNVQEYLRTRKPELSYSVVPIHDIYGPTISEEALECLVVSKETMRAADKINQVRVEKGWPELQVRVIDLVETEEDEEGVASVEEARRRLHEAKVSSSMMRFQKLGTILRPPSENNSIPRRPYLIGLTGGIASGKSTICEYLKSEHGFGAINYDQLGHRTYSQVGSPIYTQIVDYFGGSILNPETRCIERPKLGALVFGDKSKLDKLNEIVWPGIFKLVDEELEAMGSKHEVIVLESAILIEAKQTGRVHQVWSSIVPPEESISRQMKWRHLSREEAERRVSNQLDNWTRVQHSNAVFCTLWEQEVTRRQVDRCVGELRAKYLAGGPGANQ